MIVVETFLEYKVNKFKEKDGLYRESAEREAKEKSNSN